jgi:hypothetical protein
VFSFRSLPILAALILCVSGVLAVIFARPLVFAHAGFSGRYINLPRNREEVVTATGCRVYGLLAIATGLVMAWGTREGSWVGRSDRGIARSIVLTKQALERDYGLTDLCTIGQIEGAVKDAKISPRHLPYLCAAFMGRDQFDELRAHMPDVDWQRIEARVARIAAELPYRELRGDHFHESWIPRPPGSDAS